MKEIGAKLRAAREEKNITLEQIQEQTKIRLRYLEALESGDWEVIPGEVYRRGFICNFAHMVGLDGEALLHEYDNAKTPPPAAEPVCQVRNPAPEAQTVAVEKPSVAANLKPAPLKFRFKRLRPLLIVGLIAAGIFTGCLLNGGLGKNKSVVTEKQTVRKSNKAQVVLHKNAKPLVTDNAKAGQATKTTVQQLYPAPVTVYAEFSETVWVQVTSDGQVKYRGSGAIFTAKSPKQLWTANREMVIRVGNSGGLRLTLNGNEMSALGKSGQPHTIIMTVDGMEIK